MSCLISEETVNIINSNVEIEGTIDEKIQAAFADLAQTAELGNTALHLIEAYEEKIAESKKEIEENKKMYGSIASAAIDELKNALDGIQENNLTQTDENEKRNNGLDINDIENRIGKMYDHYLNAFTEFEKICDNKVSESEKLLSNVMNLLMSKKQDKNDNRIVILDKVNELLGTDDSTLINGLMTIIKNGNNDSAGEIENLKSQIQYLKDSIQTIMNERDSYQKQILEIQNNEKRKSENLSYQHFDYLFDVLPINDQQIINDQSKDETIWRLEYELQEALNQILSIQETGKIQIDSLNSQIEKLEAEKMNLETKMKLIQIDYDLLGTNLSSNQSQETVNKLMTILGCTNDNEIFQKINNLETEIKLLKIGNSTNLFMNSNDDSEKLRIMKEEYNQLKEQLVSIKNENNLNKTELTRLQNQYNQIEKQNQEYQEIINKSEKTVEPNQQNQLILLELEKFKQKTIDLQSNINMFTNISNQISSKINEVSMNNHISTKLSNSLQIIFTQFALCQFSDKSIDQLISTILNLSTGLSISSFDFIRNKIIDVCNKYKLLQNEIYGRIDQIGQRIDNILNLIINMFSQYEDLKYQINDMLNEDLAPKLSSLTAKYKKLEEENRMLRSNQENRNYKNYQSYGYSPSTEEVFEDIIHSRN